MTRPNDPTKKSGNIDAEAIAKLIDGRLSSEERDRLLSELDSNPEARAALADAAATAHELSGAKPESSVVSINARQRRRLLGPAVLAIAAALIFAVGLPLLRNTRGTGRASVMSVSATVAGLPSVIASRPWQERPWREFRGINQPVSQTGRTVRIGALIVELEALATSGDSSAARTAAVIAGLVDELPGGSIVGDQYRTLASNGVADTDARKRALSSAESLADSPAFRLGAWLEAARIAAANADSAFFTSTTVEAAVRAARDATPNEPDALRAIDALASTLAASPRDWNRVTADLNSVLAAMAN